MKKIQVSARNIFDYNYYLYRCNSKLGMMWIILSFLIGYNNLSCPTLALSVRVEAGKIVVDSEVGHQHREKRCNHKQLVAEVAALSLRQWEVKGHGIYHQRDESPGLLRVP